MVSYRCIGYGITGNDGVATLDTNLDGTSMSHSYTGSGVGELDFVASVDSPTQINSGSDVSEPYEVLDAIAYDEATEDSHNDNMWVNLSNYSVSWETGGRTVTKSTTGNGYLYASIPKISPFKDYTQPFAVEFVYLGHSGTCILGIGNGISINKYFGTFSSNINLTSGDTLKVEVTSENVKYYRNGSEITSLRTNYTEGASYVTFILNNSSISFKDFKVYPI